MSPLSYLDGNGKKCLMLVRKEEIQAIRPLQNGMSAIHFKDMEILYVELTVEGIAGQLGLLG